MPADLSKCFFCRAESSEEGFDSVVMRVPRDLLRPCGEWQAASGLTARDKIVQLHLASAAGLLEAAGEIDLARLVAVAAVRLALEAS